MTKAMWGRLLIGACLLGAVVACIYAWQLTQVAAYDSLERSAGSFVAREQGPSVSHTNSRGHSYTTPGHGYLVWRSRGEDLRRQLLTIGPQTHLAALPAGAPLVVHHDESEVWQIQHGEQMLLSYQESRAERTRQRGDLLPGLSSVAGMVVLAGILAAQRWLSPKAR